MRAVDETNRLSAQVERLGKKEIYRIGLDRYALYHRSKLAYSLPCALHGIFDPYFHTKHSNSANTS